LETNEYRAFSHNRREWTRQLWLNGVESVKQIIVTSVWLSGQVAILE
jgi:hypothetical protein